ncbi:MAG TPA: thermonuclease family protein [bacterium]|nr:thermonuclease family protein [bacterium]
MSQVKIFWDPMGFQLDSLTDTRYSSLTDGDTPKVLTSIRMLSIDTPETHYMGNPSNHDPKLTQLADWIMEGKSPVNEGLAQHLLPKLATGSAGTLQKTQGEAAKKVFEGLIEEKLTKSNGKKRNVFLWAADEHYDQYGRLLAYVSPYYTPKERDSMSLGQRATFNLLMVESGWAASFPIYPSLPKHVDLEMLHRAAREAFEKKKGAWAEEHYVPGYEYRMCMKLYEVTKKLTAGKTSTSKEKYGWVERFCVDMTTREIFYPQNYYKVKPYNRIFIWPEHVTEAVGRLNLTPPLDE